MRLACVSVDLDSVAHYCRIHGLEPARLAEDAARAVYRVAIARFVELFAAAGLKATFFAVGEDLADAASADALRAASQAGHEVGNHSQSHDYALTRRDRDAIAREVEEGARAIERVTGQAPRGFRAPGYTVSSALMQVLEQQRYRYDASVFPAAPYYLAKAGIMGALAAIGRPSKAILDRPRVLLAPTQPYRVDREEPYRRGDGLLELPVAVEPWTRVPFIGTAAVLLPKPAVRAIWRGVRRQEFVSFELHGIDLLDAADVRFPELTREQRELRVPWYEKRARLAEVLGWIAADYSVVPLEQAAQAVQPRV